MNPLELFQFDAYDHRPEFFRNIERKMWTNWLWQQQNALRNASQLQKVFPFFPNEYLEAIKIWQQRGFRFLLTPYVLALIEKDKKENPLFFDPIWRQIFPAFTKKSLFDQTSPDEYSFQKENWENADEMISPIAQHKYQNRIIIYTLDTCLGYCMYCFRSLQSNAESEKHGGKPYWKQTLEEISKRPQVEEVILSGGDPLVYDNSSLESMLKDLRLISHIKSIRIHTRAWLFNPYRMDEDFCDVLKKYAVTVLGVHITHPKEMTKDFQDAVARIRESGARTLLLTDTPLVKGVNDHEKVLHELFMNLYVSGIKPYYLSHNMPNIPAARDQRVSVRRGLELYLKLKRHISNTAMPEYTIDHDKGKKTVPESLEGTPDFIYDRDANGWPIIRLKNWKGDWEVYVDAIDE